MSRSIEVVTPTFNALEQNQGDLSPLLCADLLADPRVTFAAYDNGSHDGTAEALTAFRDKYPGRVRLNLASTNSGANTAFAWLLNTSEADEVFLFNDDYGIVGPNWFEPMILDRPAMVTFPSSPSTGRSPGLYPFDKSRYTIIQGVHVAQEYRIGRIPRAVRESCKWDTTYFYAYSDVDFLNQAVEKGFELLELVSDTPTVTRRVGYTKERTRLFEQHYQKDTDRFYTKYAGWEPGKRNE